MKFKFGVNDSLGAVVVNALIAAIALFVNGLGVYLTIHANIGVAPYDVLHIGISKTFDILYGNASIMVSLSVLIVDILLGESIGIAMIIDAFVVGKAVDFFNWVDIIPVPKTLLGSIVMIFVGIVILCYTQYFYMYAALGCGPRDTLLVGLKRIFKGIPIGLVSIFILVMSTLIGYLLGGPVGIGTLICAFCTGPIMQVIFDLVKFDATAVKHQKIMETVKVIRGEKG